MYFKNVFQLYFIDKYIDYVTDEIFKRYLN